MRATDLRPISGRSAQFARKSDRQNDSISIRSTRFLSDILNRDETRHCDNINGAKKHKQTGSTVRLWRSRQIRPGYLAHRRPQRFRLDPSRQLRRMPSWNSSRWSSRWNSQYLMPTPKDAFGQVREPLTSPQGHLWYR